MEKETQLAIQKARDLAQQKNEIYEHIDSLLDPVIKSLMESNDREEIARVLEDLPDTLHRSQLRAYLNSLPISPTTN